MPIPNAGPDGAIIATSWGQSVVDALNAAFVQGATIAANTDTSGNQSVTFPVAYSATPTVVITRRRATGNSETVQINSITPTGFSFKLLVNGTQSPNNTTDQFCWIAFGPRP